MNIYNYSMNQLNLFVNSISHLASNNVSGISITKQKTMIVAQIVLCGLSACFSYFFYKKWHLNAQKLEKAQEPQTSSFFANIKFVPQKSANPESKPSPQSIEKTSTQHENVDAGKIEQPENDDLQNLQVGHDICMEKNEKLVEKQENLTSSETINALTEQVANLTKEKQSLKNLNEMAKTTMQDMAKKYKAELAKATVTITELNKKIKEAEQSKVV